MEEWKDIKGYEGFYQVSNLGNVRSLNYNHTGKIKNLVPKCHHSGYRMVALSLNCVYKNKNIHKLVAEAFIPNPQSLPVVNHIDGNKANNTVSNLEWTTYKKNTGHAIENGLRPDSNMRGRKGDKSPIKKPVIQLSKDGTFIKEWSCISEASRQIGCSPSTIINCCAGRIKTCKKFKWAYPT